MTPAAGLLRSRTLDTLGWTIHLEMYQQMSPVDLVYIPIQKNQTLKKKKKSRDNQGRWNTGYLIIFRNYLFQVC